MALDFAPSVKTEKKIKRIAKLRERKNPMIWTEIAKEIGHSARWCKALYRWHLDQKEKKSSE